MSRNEHTDGGFDPDVLGIVRTNDNQKHRKTVKRSPTNLITNSLTGLNKVNICFTNSVTTKNTVESTNLVPQLLCSQYPGPRPN